MRHLVLLVLAVTACAGEKGIDGFVLDGKVGCDAPSCPPFETPIGVGFSQPIDIRSQAYYDPGMVQFDEDVSIHLVEDITYRLDPPSVFAATLSGNRLVITARHPGKATLVVEGTVRGVRTQRAMTLTAARAAAVRFRIADRVVDPGDEIVLARGVRYQARGYIYDDRGQRMIHEVEASPETAPFFTSDGSWKYIWSERAGVVDLPAPAGTKAGRIRFIEPTFTLDRPDAIHATLVGRDDRGTIVPIGYLDASAHSKDCVQGSDRTGYFAKAGALLMERGFDPKLTCRMTLQPETTPPGIYPQFEVVLPLQPSPELLPKS